MKVLLTGYSGFLGHYLCSAFRNEGLLVRVLLHRHTVPRKELGRNTEVLWGSVDDPDVIRRGAEGIDSVVHSAWTFNAPFEGRPTVNERAAEVLFAESVKAGVKKFAFISSVAVYGMSPKGHTLIQESSPLAKGRDLNFIYPSEKINIEKTLQEFDRKDTALAIFRPGPIFDDTKSPAMRVLRIGPWWLGVSIGNGRNQMAYIHARDVADAVVRWLANGGDGGIFNVVPSKCLRSKEWIISWGLRNGRDLKPVFVPGSVIRLVSFGVQVLKRTLGKNTKGDVNYAIACAKRDLCYSNEVLKQSLRWTDKATSEYTSFD